jgi:hypothetical protein
LYNQVVFDASDSIFQLTQSEIDQGFKLFVFLEEARVLDPLTETLLIKNGRGEIIIPSVPLYESTEAPLFLAEGMEITGDLYYAKFFFVKYNNRSALAP